MHDIRAHTMKAADEVYAAITCFNGPLLHSRCISFERVMWLYGPMQCRNRRMHSAIETAFSCRTMSVDEDGIVPAMTQLGIQAAILAISE